MSAANNCPYCLAKQRKIDELTEEVERLRQQLHRQRRRAKEGFFGSSTPSAKIPVKANTPPEKAANQGGARPGHVGHGRRAVTAATADRVVEIPAPDCCPDCGARLAELGVRERTVVDLPPIRTWRILYRLPRRRCPHCRKVFQGRVPGVAPKGLYSHQLLAEILTLHDLHGVPLGRLHAITGVPSSALIQIIHRTARRWETVVAKLREEYRAAPVKHADETGWRTDGHNGYAWLFATEQLSLFLFRPTRAATVPREVFGDQPLPGVLVVDRYAGYNQVKCDREYCYAHLLREVKDLKKEFPAVGEVQNFVAVAAPLIARAIRLRREGLTRDEFARQAAALKTQLQDAMKQPAQHLAIVRIQQIFCENEASLYHWARDPAIPADNNRAERDLRPTVIARKVSHGSQSTAGAHSRGICMSIVHSLKKRTANVSQALKDALDQTTENPTLDPYQVLFPPGTTRN